MRLRLLSKWNYEAHDYLPYTVPADWNVSVYCQDMDEIIQCPHCGRKLKYGDAYTSLEIHTELGIGYAVCSDCYDSEFKRKMDERKRQNES